LVVVTVKDKKTRQQAGFLFSGCGKFRSN